MLPENGDEEFDERSDDFMKLFRAQDVEKTKRIIGPGPFYCSFCGQRMMESGHMIEKFYLCPDAGEFTWSPPDWVRVEVDETSYVVAPPKTTAEELEKQRKYYEMCAEAHKMSRERRREDDKRKADATSELKEANDRRAGRAG